MAGYYDTELENQQKAGKFTNVALPVLAALEAIGTSIATKGRNPTSNALGIYKDVQSARDAALERALKLDDAKQVKDLRIAESAQASKRAGREEAEFQAGEDKSHRALIDKEKAIARMLGVPTVTDEATNTVTMGKPGLPDLSPIDREAIQQDPMGWLAQKIKPQSVNVLAGDGGFFTLPKSGGVATPVTTEGGGVVKPVPKPVAGSGTPKAPAGYRYAADGTLEAIPGGPADPKTKADTKPPTEDQSKAANFARRMELAMFDLAEVEKAGYNRASNEASARSSAFTPNFLNSKEGQRYSNAEKNFASANLRKESGAVIGRDEMLAQEALYFPRHGDSPETIAQKARNRAQAFEGMKGAAGPQFEKVPSMVPAAKPPLGAALQGAFPAADPRKALAQQALNDPEATEAEKAAARKILGMP